LSSSLPKVFGTFVEIADCASLAISLSEYDKTIPLVPILREEAFRYGEHLFDQALLDRTIEPSLDIGENF
jgi:hypothetical protein